MRTGDDADGQLDSQERQVEGGVIRGAWTLFPLAGVALCLLGWVGMVFGPQSLVTWGGLGFAAGAIGHLAVRSQPNAARPLRIDRLSNILRRVHTLLTAVFIGCITALLLLSFWGGGGVPDFPALETRATYELNSHGTKTQVSRVRYALDAMLFATGWHAMALTLNVSSFYKRRYGQDPA